MQLAWRRPRRLDAGRAAVIWLAASASAGAGQPHGFETASSGAGDVVLDVPYIPQTEAMCGGAAVAMSLRYWGDDRARSDDFAHLLNAEGTGIHTTALREETVRRGWRALAFRGDLAAVREHLGRGRPLIALIEVGEARFHYVTIVGLVGGRVVFHDPAVSPYTSMDGRDFVRAWESGEAWTLLVLPPAESGARDTAVDPAAAGARDASALEGPARPGPATDRPIAGPGVPGSDQACAGEVRRGVALARSGADAAARGALTAAAESCPSYALAHRELAALALRDDRARDAARRARIAVELDPSDRHAIELLAASRYVGGDDVAALEAWSRLDPVIVDEVTLGATTRTRQTEILRLSGIEPGRPLTPAALRLGRRRLDMLPAAASTRLDYRPLDEGSRVAVTAAVAERALYPSPTRLAAEAALAAFTDRGIRLRSASPLGGGELFVVDWRWATHRRRFRLSMSRPVGRPIPGVVTLGGLAAEEVYAVGASTREERRRIEARATGWLADGLRVGASLAADRWLGLATYGALGIDARVLALDDRAGLKVDGEAWSTAGAAPSFYRVGAEVDWRSSLDRRGLVAALRAGGRYASASAPRTVWPGAGTGSGRHPYARAHDLLTDGRIAGPLFGRSLVYGGAETVLWRRAGPLDLGGAVFVDLARSGRRLDGTEGRPFHADAGVGLRAGLPGGGRLRVDLAHGLVDGARRLSAGLELDAGPGR